MTDELKEKFQQLVADPPPSNGVPSDAVFSRIRTIRRRRTSTAAAAVATAAVAAVALATGTLPGPDSAPPPVTNTPGRSQTIVTGPPATTPSETPPASPSTSTGVTARTLPPVRNTDTPPPTGPQSPSDPTSPSDSTPPAVEPVKVTLRLHPTINGLTVTMRFTESGSMLAPIDETTGQSVSKDSWPNYVYMTGYTWGDGTPGAGANAGLLTCDGAHKRVTGKGSETARDPHTYAAPGTYTFTYSVWYCGPDGVQRTTKTMKLTVRASTGAP